MMNYIWLSTLALGVVSCADPSKPRRPGVAALRQDVRSTHGSGGEVGTVADRACSHLAKARCLKLTTCSYGLLLNGWRIEEEYEDDASCQTRIWQNCVDNLLVPMAVSSPAQQDACATAIDELTCTEWATRTSPAACTVTAGRPG